MRISSFESIVITNRLLDSLNLFKFSDLDKV